nr:MAG TPA: YopX protein [Bacteriophage sp.]
MEKEKQIEEMAKIIRETTFIRGFEYSAAAGIFAAGYPNDCAFDVVDDHGFLWLISEMSNIEVIGNIHDNPELLEERE